MTSAVQKYWDDFLALDPDVPKDTPYQVWFFGNTPEMASKLAGLVIAGKKTATASLAAVNELKPDETPIPGGYSVVTGFDGEPLCVIRTVGIDHLPFADVDEQMARDEGEGDQTLGFWREVHWRYFCNEAAGLGIEFGEQSMVCCERFACLFPR